MRGRRGLRFKGAGEWRAEGGRPVFRPATARDPAPPPLRRGRERAGARPPARRLEKRARAGGGPQPQVHAGLAADAGSHSAVSRASQNLTRGAAVGAPPCSLSPRGADPASPYRIGMPLPSASQHRAASDHDFSVMAYPL